MKKIINLRYLCIGLCILFMMIFSSCKKWISINPPKTQLTTGQVFADNESATAAILNIYTWFENYNLEANLMPDISLYADEVYPTTADEQAMEYYNNSISPDDYSNANMWKYLYFIIYESNSVLSNLSHSSAVSPKVKKQLTGEAMFLRAFAYYFLVNLYGDIPLVISTNVTVTSVLPRTSADEIYNQIIKDLKEAENNLADKYPTWDKTRANKWCAAALLARVYLYTKDWKDAEKQSTEVISSGKYTLDPLDKVFLENSQEAILQCWQQNGYTVTGSNYLPGSPNEAPLYAMDSSLLAAFEPGDRRKREWLDSVVVSGKVYYYPYKYKLQSATTGGQGEYTMLLRLGEQYLIRAEACAQQNELTKAINNLNVIRARAGLNDLPETLTQAEILSAVEKERRVELFTEWGQRFFDLKRTGMINVVLGSLKPHWKPTAQLFPIPQNELNNNPHLIQNEGY